MRAMVLAAGLGTRLRPLTNDRPKALVEVCGRTLLEITLLRLKNFGVRDVIVNAHYLADELVDYLRENQNFGMHIEVSRESVLLDTGGGLKQAAHFLRGAPDEPFLLHNVDVISTIDLARMTEAHLASRALATLAVQQRKSSRYLLFDDDDLLRGRVTDAGDDSAKRNTSPGLRALAFSGIHVISPRIFSLMNEDGAFSIIDCYLRQSAEGERVRAFGADQYYWRDLGRPEHIQRASAEIAQWQPALG